jgi:uncharacterized protein
MNRTIIVHGMPDKEEYFDPEASTATNAHWLPWLKKSLITAEIPAMPEPYDPDYRKWKSVFETYEIDQHTNLVGHSCGAGFLVRWLSESKITVGKVALVAPWIDPTHSDAPHMFSDWQIDGDIVKRTTDTCIFVSLDDEEDILKSVRHIQSILPDAKIQTFTHRGHFTLEDMHTDEFPELLEYLSE